MLSALLVACRNHLRGRLHLKPAECEVMPDERPPPSSGDLFISVHPLGWSPGDTNDSLVIDEVYQVGITICRRIRPLPHDRVFDSVFVTRVRGIEDLARKVISALHHNWDVISDANNLIAAWGGSGYNIIEPLRWQGCDPSPVPRDASWLFQDHEPDAITAAAMSLQVRFAGVRRINTVFNPDPQV